MGKRKKESGDKQIIMLITAIVALITQIIGFSEKLIEWIAKN